jgi:hypothetical protein
MMTVIGYYIDQNWTLHEVQLAFDEVCGHLDFYFLPLTNNYRLKPNTLDSSCPSIKRRFYIVSSFLMADCLE